MRKFISIGALATLLLSVSAIAAKDDVQKGLTNDDREVLQEATEVLQASTSAPDQGIPRDLLQRAECVVVFPEVVKGAFVVGGRFGRGVATCRQADGQLGAPAFMSIGGASVGWQWGVSETSFVLLVMNDEGMKKLLEDKVTLGGSASAAIGPVGRSAEAATDAQMHAQILSWSRSKGAFAGASLEGAVIQASQDGNERMYGHKVSVRDIVLSPSKVTPTTPAEGFLSVARNLTARGAHVEVGKS